MNSKLQIISGKFHGRKLTLPPDARPTQNRARESIFNMLASGILVPDEKYFFWDAFAGSGAIGIEFLSRYQNAKVLFSDLSDSSIKTIKKNLSDLKINSVAKTEQKDAIKLIETYGKDVDFVFVDPPYDQYNQGKIFIDTLAKVAKNGVYVLWEQEKSNFIAPSEKWEVIKDKTYGRARFLLLQLKSK